MVLMFLMMLAFRGTARLSGLPRASALFWRTTAWAMCAYGAGMAFDLVSLLSHFALGRQAGRLGMDLMYPVAGVLTIVAMYQYPTTARTRGERITVGMDAGIVLLGSAVFVWYFTVSRGWTPEAGPTALFQALVQPVLSLVAGFAVLKIAYIGAAVISRPTLVCFGASIAISVICGSVPAWNNALAALAVEIEMLSPLVALVGGVYQYTSSAKLAQAPRATTEPGGEPDAGARSASCPSARPGRHSSCSSSCWNRPSAGANGVCLRHRSAAVHRQRTPVPGAAREQPATGPQL
jgi:hypothetical protein